MTISIGNAFDLYQNKMTMICFALRFTFAIYAFFCDLYSIIVTHQWFI